MQARIVNGKLEVVNDFIYADHGSVVLLTALTKEAREWADEHLPQDRQTWGPLSTAIEWRYFSKIANGILDDGLTIDKEQA